MRSRTMVVLILVTMLGTILSFYGVSDWAAARSSDSATTLISRSSAGVPGNDYSLAPFITADGRFVAFASAAGNLTDDADISGTNIYVHDRQTGQTTLVSRALDSTPATEASSPSLSAGGRFVAYASLADDLVASDTNESKDIFVTDTITGQTSRVSRHSDGTQSNDASILPAISGDGRFVAFVSWADNLTNDSIDCCRNVYLHDRQTGQTQLISKAVGGESGNGDSTYPALSADGRYVVFESGATNLVSGADENGGGVNGSDIFIYDRQVGQMTRISHNSDGVQGDGASVIPSVSADGRLVAFQSFATNLVDDDTNGWPDIFVHDHQTGQTTLVSRRTDGELGDYVSGPAFISANGRYVAFRSLASNLVDDDENNATDAFRHDRQTGQTILVSRNSDGVQGNNTSGPPPSAKSVGVTNDGVVVFESDATNLVASDTNGTWDIFAHGPPKEPLPFASFVPVVFGG